MARPAPEWLGRKPELVRTDDPKTRALAWKAAAERRRLMTRKFEELRRVTPRASFDLGRLRREWTFGPRGTFDLRKKPDDT